jgi:hypothetical protein
VTGALLPLILAAGVALAAKTGDTPARGIRLTEIASGFEHPVHLTGAPGDARLFVVEQTGRIRTIENGRPADPPFLDLSEEVSRGSERGLLSVAFHPRFAENGLLFVNYTDRRGDTRVVRYAVTSDRSHVDTSSAKLILTVEQPYANHNGGQVLFGLDGMLYVPLGDGGSGGDPGNRGQDLSTLLGKLLRIDVDRGEPYETPKDNPFVNTPGARPEIWALGLRNPWRIAFDRESGLLYIADVGQNQWEEVDVVRANRSGLNYGWRLFEGTHDYRREKDEPRDLIFPLIEYPHSEGCSITGGVVYRGERVRALRGAYLYADYCRGWLRSFRVDSGRAIERHEWRVTSPGPISSFGVDDRDEVYVVGYEGKIYRIDPED